MTTLIFDALVAVIFLYFLVIGWHKGLFKTILGPISLILCAVISYIVYHQTQDWIITGSIGLFGPFILRIILGIGAQAWQKFVNDGEPPSKFSRFAGGFITILWRGSFIMLFILAVGKFESDWSFLKEPQNFIRSTRSFMAFNRLSETFLPYFEENMEEIKEFIKNPYRKEQVAQSESYQQLMANETFKSFVDDQQAVSDMDSNNLTSLIMNKNFFNLLRDGEVIEQMIAVTQEIQSQPPTASGTPYIYKKNL